MFFKGNKSRALKYRLWPAFVFSVLVILPITAMALKSLNQDDMLNNSPALKSDMTREKKLPETESPETESIDSESEDLKLKDDISIEGEVNPAELPREIYLRNLSLAFQQAVCFECHKRKDIDATTKTQKQWRVLIEDNGHEIFQSIPWSNPEEKRNVMQHLLEHAKQTNPKSEGIGIW
jgi:hypothetical protein